MVSNEDTVVAIALVGSQSTHDVHIPFVEENIGVVARHLALHIPQGNIGDVVLPGVFFDGGIDLITSSSPPCGRQVGTPPFDQERHA